MAETRCMDDTVALDYATGKLEGARFAEAEQHVAECADCRALVAALMQTTGSRPRGDAATRRVLAPGAQVDRYLVLAELGAGAMGVVYAAFDAKLDRRCCLKVLHPAPALDAASRGHAKLEAEAKAMARLAHPNVVTVHDVLAWGGQLILVMELVDGLTLAQWRTAKARSHEEILRVFRDAGAGLAAAHRAGIVHRDFKPSNVLVGDDGRAKVADFGLAHLVEQQPAAGAVHGTPAYMAPEQRRSRPVDARADQFSFCLALLETLTGENPWRTCPPVADEAQLSAPFAALPRALAALPRPAASALQRGLRQNPEERFANMEALLSRLQSRRPGSARVVLAVATLTLALVFGGVQLTRVRACESDATLATLAWGAREREQVSRAFNSLASPLAGQTLPRVAQRLDAFVERWAEARRATCGWVPAPEAPQVQACLAGQLLHLRSLIPVLAELQEPQRALQAVSALPEPSSCADPRLARPARPVDPALEPQAAVVREGLARATALQSTGRYADASAELERQVAAARRLGDDALLGEALALLGWALGNQEQPEPSRQALQEAAVLALRAGDRLTAARCWLRMSAGGGFDSGESLRLAQFGMAEVERAGRPPEMMALAHTSLGNALSQLGRWTEAAEEHRLSASAARAYAGPDSYGVGVALFNLGGVLGEAGRMDESAQAATEALELFKRVLGPGHPFVADCLDNLATLDRGGGRMEAAIARSEQSLAIRRETQGTSHPEYCFTALSLASARFLAAPSDASQAAYLAALSALEAVESPSGHAGSALQVAEDLLARGRPAAALPLCERAKRILGESVGADHPLLAQARSALGRTLLELHAPARAVPELEAALRVQRARDLSLRTAVTALALSQALPTTPAGRKQAETLAEEAEKLLTAQTSLQRDDHEALRQVRQWRAELQRR